MINIKFSNQASTVLEVEALVTDTAITVADPTTFPTIQDGAFFMICVSNAGDFEIMKVIAVEDNVFTVQRSQEGTAGKAFPIGSSVENRLTAGSLNSIIKNASETVSHATTDVGIIGQATDTLFGHIKITDDDASEASSALGVGISPYGMKTAFNRILGASTTTIISSSTLWTVPVTGTYNVIAVGGGGSGGSSGFSAKVGAFMDTTTGYCYGRASIGGGGGGGGGAGQVQTSNIALTEGAVINISIGGPAGTTSFGSYLTALGGGNGNAGGNAGGYVHHWSGGSPSYPITATHFGGAGGAAGTSYGSAATAGGAGSSPVGEDGCVHHWAYGGAGGIGGSNAQAPYGSGGAGAKSPDRPGTINDVIQYGISYGTSGTPGTQGCVKIKLNVG